MFGDATWSDRWRKFRKPRKLKKKYLQIIIIF